MGKDLHQWAFLLESKDNIKVGILSYPRSFLREDGSVDNNVHSNSLGEFLLNSKGIIKKSLADSKFEKVKIKNIIHYKENISIDSRLEDFLEHFPGGAGIREDNYYVFEPIKTKLSISCLEYSISFNMKEAFNWYFTNLSKLSKNF